MKTFQIIKKSNMWSTDTLTKDVEKILETKSKEGYEIVSVSFGLNLFWIPTAFITLSKEN